MAEVTNKITPALDKYKCPGYFCLMKTFFAILGVVVGLAVVGIGIYWLGWGIRLQDAKNQYYVNTNTQQYQAGIISRLRDDATAYQNAQPGAQRTAISEQFCSLYKDLTEKPADLVSANYTICSTN